ncbi:MAG: diaminopimelate epimerase [Peptostreptococcaceae bacterium]|nr:diaminopimelate epimerase [Peptostreptococcaceae bacterium]
MEFTKMHGAGNDFIIINNMVEKIKIEKLNSIAKEICARRMSLGADGLMVVDNPTEGGDYKMRFYNSDGSLGEMCGNGARCIARYGYENKLAGHTQKIETAAGMVYGKRIDEVEYQVRLNDVTTMKTDIDIVIEDNTYMGSYVELGNPGLPHVAVPIKDLKNADRDKLKVLGRKIRNYDGFPKGANVNFYEIIGEDHILELTYERGVEDYTYACGTGTGSVVAALTVKGEVSGKNVVVDMNGGQLRVSLDYIDGEIKELMLTGPTKIVAIGKIIA